MQFISIDQIVIPDNRQRQEFDPDAIQELGSSIVAHGVLHPPVLREVDGHYLLVAGERRLRAMRDLLFLGHAIRCGGVVGPEGMVPFLNLGQLDPLAAEEAELDENLKRRDLTWQEQAAAIARLHALRTAQAEAVGKKQLVKDTALEVVGKDKGGFAAGVAQKIILADHLSNPLVAAAKTPKDAIKILERQEAAAKNEALAERVGRTFSSAIHELHHTDCLTWMATCPAGTFDVILTDPPYGMDADKFGDGAGRMGNNEHHYSDDVSSWRTLVTGFASAAFRVAKPQAHAYIFCDIDRFHELRSIFQAAGWYVFRTPLINTKPKSGRVPLPEHGPRRQYELILYAIKGHKKVTAIYSDVIETVLEESISHGAQKPVELYVNLLRRSVAPGDVVLDAFAGTGTIFPAAHAMKCKAVGLEMSPEYYGMSVKRLNSLDAEPELV